MHKFVVLPTNLKYMCKIYMLITCLVLTVFRSQKDITVNMALALKKLCGWDWGGHGNTVFLFLVHTKKKMQI